MLEDIEASTKVNEEFKSGRKIQNIDLSVTVLSEASWPKQGLCKPTLPRIVLDSFQLFNDFYTKKFNGRKLTQINHRGEGEINFFSLTKKPDDKVLLVNSLQMIVLMLFNKQQEMTAKQIENETKIPFKLLTVVLESLTKPLSSSNGSNVLKNLSGSKNVLESDTFSVNDNFTHHRKSLKIPIIFPNRDGVIEGRLRREKNNISQDQKIFIDAAIVRIMKRKKNAQHQVLVDAVIEQLRHRFKPDVKFLEKRIEYLIVKKYIERDSRDRSLYNYVA